MRTQQRDQSGLVTVGGRVGPTGVVNSRTGEWSVSRSGTGVYVLRVPSGVIVHVETTTDVAQVAGFAPVGAFGGNSVSVWTLNQAFAATDLGFAFTLTYRP